MLTQTKKNAAVGQQTRALSEFLATIRYEDLPEPVIGRVAAGRRA